MSAAKRAAIAIGIHFEEGREWDESVIAEMIEKEMSADFSEVQTRLIERTEQSMATALRDAETIRILSNAVSKLAARVAGDNVLEEVLKRRAPKAADARGWHPMETAPRSEKVIFWIIPKPLEECNVHSNGQPITSWNSPHFMFCEYGCWPSVDKAVAWMEPPSEPSPIPV